MKGRALLVFIVTLPVQAQLATVPFTGCKSDGQVGPMEAPAGAPVALPISPDAAQRLAYYKAAIGPVALGPRGWHCFGTYGSSGATLYVSPGTVDGKNLFAPDWHGFTGPAIQISLSDGGTSGRFEVARIIARVFPAHRAFADQVIAEGFEDSKSFPFGPWPADKLTYKGGDIVEYDTPANSDGLGTASRLAKNADPIRGVAIVTGPETGLIHLSIRLPEEMSKLAPIIVQQTEREAAEAK